ncbi:hypothetical protein G6F22_017344 [Rhizopus arrhizus]|nr:hypothetical protein G6F22_017344 [Rhizopus arrhizus]
MLQRPVEPDARLARTTGHRPRLRADGQPVFAAGRVDGAAPVAARRGPRLRSRGAGGRGRGRRQQRLDGRRLAVADAGSARAGAAAHLGHGVSGGRADPGAGADRLGTVPAPPLGRPAHAGPADRRGGVRLDDRVDLHDVRRRHDPEPALCRVLRADLSAAGVRGADRAGLGHARRHAGNGDPDADGAVPKRPGRRPLRRGQRPLARAAGHPGLPGRHGLAAAARQHPARRARPGA